MHRILSPGHWPLHLWKEFLAVSWWPCMFSQSTILKPVTHISEWHCVSLSASVCTESQRIPLYLHRYGKSTIVFSGRHTPSKGMAYRLIDTSFLMFPDELPFPLGIRRCCRVKISTALCPNGDQS